ncbi:4Fe-4S ferredoxin [Microcoleus vaginatus PCC 9802]|uniref:circadian clock protein LdpA n=1 Tax=Microcoleus vaginatus TaxID=119532 RepID=UPI00020D2146|nr:4Fe-4S ferredoxin, iron-sulfur binding [Microcoleus vaginatus FGP-2]UNU19981.1 4Fe-4S ferredoxin [Microcoleus vaginatus PCC 9802]
MTEHYHPLNSLKGGHWFKLICGASFQHLPAVRNLTLAYTLAGADCIDVAADPAAVAAAKEALQVASELQARTQNRRFGGKGLPWLMVSLNDGEDPHFRKAEFNPADCPVDCWRPCEKICPAEAIVFQSAGSGFSGVIDQQCYGCGRCLPICPSQLIYTRSYVSAPAAIAPLILQSGADALEIHTQVGREADFARLWSSIAPWVGQLKVIAISCPDGDGLIDYLRTLYQIISPLPCPLIWQTDGRPMSGDIGTGTTRAAVKLGQKVLAAQLPGYVQLAGGTNAHTVSKLRADGLLKDGGKNLLVPPVPYIAGVAYGSYARVLLSPILEQLETMQTDRAYAVPVAVARSGAGVQTSRLPQLEAVPELLSEAVSLACSLVSQLKEF